jgi:non-reducing end alpha-L-arabinofuranosidase
MKRTHRTSRAALAGLAATALVGVTAVITAGPAAAAAGCRVDYTITNSWGGGFGANVAVTNLGDPVNGWRVSWSYTAGQTVTQLWNGSYTQSGAQVTVTNAAYNASIATGATTSFGFNGTWTGSNPAPAAFALNGTTCTGGVVSPPPTSHSVTPGSTPPSSPPPAGQGPCDIYAAGGTPCVAAHSTTRALYGSYNGPLYQVRRSSDNTTRDIGVRSPGGVVNAAAQDSFCAGTNCVITILYDQSGRDNRLTQAPPGYWKGPAAGGYDNLADAKAAPITVGGQKAYGVYIAPGTGYRNNNTNGVAKGDQPEGIYAVVDGTHYNNWCCFDYGNAQTDGQADSPAIMETVYFGADKQWGWGSGNGPWIMGDLEWGLFSGDKAGYNNLAPISHRFVTAVVKGEPNHWAIRGGDAQSGGLTNYFDGKRPSGYNPMKKEGAILLGIGGDNSVSGRGTFYEGVLTTGYPSAATENAVQANITAAGYHQ